MTRRSASPASRSPAGASAGSAGIAAAWPSPRPSSLALGVSACSLVCAQFAALRLEAEVRHWVDEGAAFGRRGPARARLEPLRHGRAARPGRSGRLRGLHDRIRQEDRLAPRDQGDPGQGRRVVRGRGTPSVLAARIRRRPQGRLPRVESALAKFSVPDDPAWAWRQPIGLLDGPRRERLIDEVNELLFLWVFALDREWHGDPATARQAIRICDVALAFAPTAGPWRAIRARCAATLAGEPPPSQVPARTEGETSARGCFQWALLCDLEGRTEAAVAWLERATLLEPSDYWSQFYLGSYHQRLGQNGRAMEHYQAAVALRPDSPWARSNRVAPLSRAGRLGSGAGRPESGPGLDRKGPTSWRPASTSAW